jgi:hypothetical protein
MSLNLDLQTFGRTPACRILAEKLNRHGDAKLATAVTNVFTPYFGGLREMMKLNNPYRHTLMKMWFDAANEKAKTVLEERLAAADIPFSYVTNIIHHKFRQASEHSAIIEKFNGDEHERDYKAVLDKLVDMDRRRDYLVDQNQI